VECCLKLLHLQLYKQLLMSRAMMRAVDEKPMSGPLFFYFFPFLFFFLFFEESLSSTGLAALCFIHHST